jgi:hypothetical protein
LLKGPDPHYDLARENGELRAERDELLAALEDCIHQIADDTKPAAKRARAAIVKAER